MMIGQKMWTSYQWPIFERVQIFFVQTLYLIYHEILNFMHIFGLKLVDFSEYEHFAAIFQNLW